MKNFGVIVLVFFFLSCCKKEVYVYDVAPTCLDGLQNGGETGIDCGGPCPNACPNQDLAHTQKYYVTFLYDTTPVVIQSDTDFGIIDANAGPFTIYGQVQNSSSVSAGYAFFSIDNVISPDATDLVMFSGSTLYFEQTNRNSLVAHFNFRQANGTNGNTIYTQWPKDSVIEMIIEDAAIDNGYALTGNHKVLFTGKFSAKVAGSQGSAYHTITKGSFGVPFGADD